MRSISIFFFLLVLLNLSNSIASDPQGYYSHPLISSEALEPFRRCLQDIAGPIRDSYAKFPKIFICYSSDEEFHRQSVKALWKDLKLTGIPEKNLLLDVKTNRPGSGKEVSKYIKIIEKVPKVIVAGSPSLKNKYDKYKNISLGDIHDCYTAQELKMLMRRRESNGWEGVIPIWFQGKYEENFPSDLPDIVRLDLSTNYTKYFFELLKSILMNVPAINAENSLIDQYYERFLNSRNSHISSSTMDNQRIQQFGAPPAKITVPRAEERSIEYSKHIKFEKNENGNTTVKKEMESNCSLQ